MTYQNNLKFYRHIGVSHNPTGTKTSAITTSKKNSSTSKESTEHKKVISRKLKVEVNAEDDDPASFCSLNSIRINDGRNKKEMFLVASNSHIPSGIGVVIEDNTKQKGRKIRLNN